MGTRAYQDAHDPEPVVKYVRNNLRGVLLGEPISKAEPPNIKLCSSQIISVSRAFERPCVGNLIHCNRQHQVL
jgi:hypothetical protein